MELWLACKSLASSLCVEARLLTQIFGTSSQHPSRSSCQLTALCARPSTAVVLENRYVAFEGGKYNPWLRGMWSDDTFLHDLCPEPSTLHSLASSRRPTRVCVRISARCTAAPYRYSQKLDSQDQAVCRCSSGSRREWISRRGRSTMSAGAGVRSLTIKVTPRCVASATVLNSHKLMMMT
jgi:hypothetical protein